jgi:hypothetical protein
MSRRNIPEKRKSAILNPVLAAKNNRLSSIKSAIIMPQRKSGSI